MSGEMSDSPKFWSLKTGLLAMALAPLFAISPYIFGALLSVAFCGPDANEGNCAWAALPWFMFFTIPAAAVLFITGVVILIGSFVKRKN